MTIARNADPSRPAVARSIAALARTVLAMLVLALAVAMVAFVRTFVFEYFHGDRAAPHGLVQLFLGN